VAVLRPAGEFDESYEYDMATLRRPWQAAGLLLLLVALYLLPLYGSQTNVSLVNRILIAVIAVQGLNLLTGYTGQISLGQAAFMTVGGYISALLVSQAGWPFLAALPVAALGAGLVGLLFGLPSLRVKGFYLTMATLAAQFIIPWFSRQAFPEVLNGTQGIVVPLPVIFGAVFDTPQKYLYLCLTLVIITTIVAKNISRSRSGRAYVAIRDNDLAAELLGVNPFAYKLQAFFLAAVYGGIAGVLLAHNLRHINSESVNLVDSIFYLGMLVVGGLGTNLGPFFGATVVILLTELATVLGPAAIEAFPFLPPSATSAMRPLLFGLALMLFLIFEPRGLAHRWQQIKAAWRLRPFSY
jgi:branched-chain amino acid transport system permease protein